MPPRDTSGERQEAAMSRQQSPADRPPLSADTRSFPAHPTRPRQAASPHPPTSPVVPQPAQLTQYSLQTTSQEGTRTMTTQRQIAANRKNAQRSTGPRTPRGKAVASRNNTQHGLYSSSHPSSPRLESPQAWAEHHRCHSRSHSRPPTPSSTPSPTASPSSSGASAASQRYEHTVTTLAQQQAAARSRRRARRSRHSTSRRSAARFAARPPRACAPSTDSIHLHRRRSHHRRRGQPDHPRSSRRLQLPGFDLATFSAPGLLEPRPDRIEDTPRLDRRPPPADIVDAIADATEQDPDALVQSRPRRRKCPSRSASIDPSPATTEIITPTRADRSAASASSPRTLASESSHPLRDPPHPPAQPDPQPAAAAPAPPLHRAPHRAAILLILTSRTRLFSQPLLVSAPPDPRPARRSARK